jgi:ERCC4-type nuclease
MFGLSVRFTCEDEATAEAFDRLAEREQYLASTDVDFPVLRASKGPEATRGESDNGA